MKAFSYTELLSLNKGQLLFVDDIHEKSYRSFQKNLLF